MHTQPGGGRWTLLPLRLMIGFGFAAHGYAKLSRGPERFAEILTSIGAPEPQLTAWATTLLELLGGISLMLGAFVTPLSLPLIVVMLTAMFSVHLQYGFSSIRLEAVSLGGAEFGPVGYELNLLYIAGLLTLVLHGPDRYSVDYWLGSAGRQPTTIAPEDRTCVSKISSDSTTTTTGPTGGSSM